VRALRSRDEREEDGDAAVTRLRREVAAEGPARLRRQIDGETCCLLRDPTDGQGKGAPDTVERSERRIVAEVELVRAVTEDALEDGSLRPAPKAHRPVRVIPLVALRTADPDVRRAPSRVSHAARVRPWVSPSQLRGSTERPRGRGLAALSRFVDTWRAGRMG